MTQIDQSDIKDTEKYITIKTKISDLTAKINQMETDETLSNLRHESHLLKEKVHETAKDGAALSYLQRLVEAHIKQIKDKRLPFVVKDATDILKTLTE